MALKLIAAPIKLNESSENVANLHRALNELGYTIAKRETTKQLAGVSTQSAIKKALGNSQRISVSGNTVVNKKTASALNDLLLSKGLLTAHDTAPNPNDPTPYVGNFRTI